jgi:hypothetical protein
MIWLTHAQYHNTIGNKLEKKGKQLDSEFFEYNNTFTSSRGQRKSHQFSTRNHQNQEWLQHCLGRSAIDDWFGYAVSSLRSR